MKSLVFNRVKRWLLSAFPQLFKFLLFCFLDTAKRRASRLCSPPFGEHNVVCFHPITYHTHFFKNNKTGLFLNDLPS